MEKLKKQKCEFKQFASQAKKRLTSGYWQQVKVDRDKCLKQNQGTDLAAVNSFYTTHLKRQIMPKTKEQGEEDELYEKVCKILETSGSSVVNPIAVLMPHEHMATLNDCQRELFVMRFSEKITKLIKQYEQEKQLKIV